jgi:DNA-binding transcriptional LysR family regulator
MNISHLEVFIATVQSASISKAADNLHLTQPAVSMQIQSLESSLGYQLLTRSNRGVQLTKYGKVFFAYAQSFLTLWGNLRHDLKMLDSKDALTLQVGTCPAIGQYALPCALYLYKQVFPQIQVSVQSLSNAEVIAAVTDHSLQVGFIEGVPAPKNNLQSYPVLTSELMLVTSGPQSHDLFHLKELTNLPLILPPESSEIRQALKTNLTRQKIDPAAIKPFLELDGIEAVKSAVISGHGYSLLPYFAIKKELVTGDLKPVMIGDAKLEITFTMIWRQEKEPAEYCRNFLQFIQTKGVKIFC